MQIFYSESISWQLLNDNIYIIEERSRQLISLQEVAKDFWLLIREGISLEDIITKLCLQYNEERELIFNDIKELCDDLMKLGLIKEG